LGKVKSESNRGGLMEIGKKEPKVKDRKHWNHQNCGLKKEIRIYHRGTARARRVGRMQ
jgi:hypothetical protein